jgi:hypothetical protein
VGSKLVKLLTCSSHAPANTRDVPEADPMCRTTNGEREDAVNYSAADSALLLMYNC